MRTRRLHFIRHGRSLGNELKLFAGQTDVPLTEAGRAKLLRYKHQGIYPYADLYYASGLSRAQETLKTLFPAVAAQAQFDPRFNEAYFGELENAKLSHEEEVAYFARYYRNEDQGHGEERFQESRARVLEASLEILKRLETEDLHSAAICCHCGVIKCAASLWHGVTRPEALEGLAADNGSLWTYVFHRVDGEFQGQLERMQTDTEVRRFKTSLP